MLEDGDLAVVAGVVLTERQVGRPHTQMHRYGVWNEVREDAVHALLQWAGKLKATGRRTPLIRCPGKDEAFENEPNGAPLPVGFSRRSGFDDLAWPFRDIGIVIHAFSGSCFGGRIWPPLEICLVAQGLETMFVENVSDGDHLCLLYAAYGGTGDAWGKELAGGKGVMDGRGEV
ncbi:hypothetical protein APSETT444_000094 [Aspergillus pseudonomiae]